jgi:hypothetical protein
VSKQRECYVRDLWFLQERTEICIGALGGKNGKENPPLNLDKNGYNINIYFKSI